MLLRQSLAKTPKILAPNGHSISLNALVRVYGFYLTLLMILKVQISTMHTHVEKT